MDNLSDWISDLKYKVQDQIVKDHRKRASSNYNKNLLPHSSSVTKLNFEDRSDPYSAEIQGDERLFDIKPKRESTNSSVENQFGFNVINMLKIDSGIEVSENKPAEISELESKELQLRERLSAYEKGMKRFGENEANQIKEVDSIGRVKPSLIASERKEVHYKNSVNRTPLLLAKNEAISQRIREDGERLREEERLREQKSKIVQRIAQKEKDEIKMGLEARREKSKMKALAKQQADKTIIDKRNMEEKQRIVILEERQRIVQESKKKQEEEKKKMIQENRLIIFEAKRRMRILTKCFSSWNRVVDEKKFALNRYLTLSRIRLTSKYFKNWLYLTHKRTQQREIDRIEFEASRLKQLELTAINFYNTRSLSTFFIMWLSKTRMTLDKKLVQKQHHLRKMKMEAFLQKSTSHNPPTITDNLIPNNLMSLIVGQPPIMDSNNPLIFQQLLAQQIGQQILSQQQHIPSIEQFNPQIQETLMSPRRLINPGSQKFLEAQTNLNAKAEERKERLKFIEEQKRQARDSAKQKQLEEARLEKERRIVEEKALMKQRQLEREAMEKRKQELQRLQQEENINMGKAKIHYEKHSTIRLWKKWRDEILDGKEKMNLAVQANNNKILKMSLIKWLHFVKENEREKMELANQWHLKKSKQKCFVRIKQWLKYAKLDDKIADHHYSAKTNFSTLKKWRAVHLKITAHKNQIADTFFESFALRWYLRIWREYVIETKLEREKEERKSIWRGKISNWISDYRGSRTEQE
eukprot:TRINITY_DN423_c0_g2_i1.p1 TRINITY_DN423_c0_g2~~TRINITY_DN423_c0_g2_i1.p1  ORF type:complete len:754 (-),score=105.21 TRINITY_DN423_c0_g2_i1:248-2509(-)